jgi:Bacterial Ig-like domain/Bacterial Ig-like domain (group 2)
MKTRLALVALIALGWVGGCSDTPTEHRLPASLEGLVVSDPGPALAASVTGADVFLPAGGVGDSLVYVSLEPGTAPTGIMATLINLGSGRTVSTPVQDGGFDPVPLAARIGDSVEVAVRDWGGTVVADPHTLVAARRTPRVIRTSPLRGKRDVALNSIISVVFSEPVAGNTVTPASVQLFRGTTPVAGTVNLLQPTTVVFTPAAPLDPNTEYQLQVTREVRDLQGDQLDSALTVDFTTGTTLLSPVREVAVLGVAGDSVLGVPVGTVAQLVAVPYDSNFAVIAGRPATWLSSDPAVASVSESGLFRALSPGRTLITATVDGVMGNRDITVQ